MEKVATYTVMNSKHPIRKELCVWVCVCVSVVAVVVACVAAVVVKEQEVRISHLEMNLMELEGHLAEILKLSIANHEYDYEDYRNDDYQYVDDQPDNSEGLTVRKVVRRRREVSTEENEVAERSNVPIFDRAYGINVKGSPKGLTLYSSLLDNKDDQSQVENQPEVTDSPIKSHHRISSMWVSKRRRSENSPPGPSSLSSRTIVKQEDSSDDEEDNEMSQNIGPIAKGIRRSSHEIKPSDKTQYATRRGVKRSHKQRYRPNKETGSVIYRTSLVKATTDDHEETRHRRPNYRPYHRSPPGSLSRSRNHNQVNQNSVVPQTPNSLDIPTVVEQDTRRKMAVVGSSQSSAFGKRRKPHRRRRRQHPAITVAHFGVSFRNQTQGNGEQRVWAPASWMDKLGLSKKYDLTEEIVTVKEAGLYYVYAQVLYESGRSAGGFQVLADNTPVVECQVPALRPAPTCYTGGLTYLPRGAEVTVRDINTNLVTVGRHHNTFFGLIKLMNAR